MSRPMAELIDNIPPDRDSNKLLIIANNFNVSISKKDTGAGTSSGDSSTKADKIKDNKNSWNDDSFFTKMGKTLGLTPRSSEEERERAEEKEKKAERIRKEQHDALKKGFSSIGKSLKGMATDNPIVNFIKDHWGKILIGLALAFLKPEQMKKVWIGIKDAANWLLENGPEIFGKMVDVLGEWIPKIGGWIGNIVDFFFGKKTKKDEYDAAKEAGPEKRLFGPDETEKEFKTRLDSMGEYKDGKFKGKRTGGAGTITTIATLGFALFALLKPLSALKLVLWTIPKMLAKLLKLDVLGGKLFNPILTSVKGFGSKMLNGAKGILGMKPSYTRPHATPTELAFKKSHSGIGKSVLSSTSEVAGKGVAGETGKAALKTVAKEAGKEAVKTAGKKGLAKVALKGAGTLAAKATPGLGLLISGGMSVKRMFDGDFMGAGMELASGVASLAPGLGTAASIAIQTALIAKDAGVFAKEAVKTTEDAKTDSPITAKKTTTQRMIAKEPVIKGKPYSKRQLAAVSMGRQMGNNIPVTKEEEMGRAVLKKENASNLGPIVSPTAKIDNMNGLTTKNSALKGDGSTVIIDNSQKNSNNVTKSGGSGSTTVLAKRNVESGYRLTGSDYGKSFNGL